MRRRWLAAVLLLLAAAARGAAGVRPDEASRECWNGGTPEGALDGSVRCRCAPGWAGPDCRAIANPCASDPCLHGGRCVTSPGNVAYTCACQPGFHGGDCQHGRDPCARGADPPLCRFGVCAKTPGPPVCECYAGASGRFCEYGPCELEPSTGDAGPTVWGAIGPCTGAGAEGGCVSVLVPSPPSTVVAAALAGLPVEPARWHVEARCRCRPGFVGVRCELDLNLNGCASRPCRNGGRCADLHDAGGHRCYCQHPWAGPDCSRNRSADADDPRRSCAYAGCDAGGTCPFKPLPPFVPKGERPPIDLANTPFGPLVPPKCEPYIDWLGDAPPPPADCGTHCRFWPFCEPRCRYWPAEGARCDCLPGRTGRLCEREAPPEGSGMVDADLLPGLLGVLFVAAVVFRATYRAGCGRSHCCECRS